MEENIVSIAIEDEMQKSYLDYSMSVIVSRALPDVRDGLKPVHRRILYSMYENGYNFNKPFKKSARIVGDVMGKYHPHGDAAIYDAMVRMAQDFSMRLPMISSQGNFGSMDGDEPAAMRYTEARLAQISDVCLEDLDKDTVDFIPNYDESLKEPTAIPMRFPYLLVNGTNGIAVGMATNIPTHNLGEVLDGCCAYIDDNSITSEGLMQYIKGPDFPTGGIILGTAGIRSMYTTGRGTIMVRSVCQIEEYKGKTAIIVSEIPYQVNKAQLVAKIGELARDKIIDGISAVHDLSNREGIRIIIEIRRDAQADVILNQLYKNTQLQNNFPANILAINAGKPMMMDLRGIIESFVSFRQDVVKRRTAYLLGKARDRAHLLVGLAIAVENIDKIITIIRQAPDPNFAKEQLMAENWNAQEVEYLVKLIDEPDRKVIDGKYKLSESQAKGILELRLHRLTGLERDKIHNELKELGAQIKEYLDILSSRERICEIMKNEFMDIKNRFATPRKTQIQVYGDFNQDEEDLIPREDMVVTVTNTGYIKRVPLSTYKAQRRGGKGRSAMSTHEEDFVTKLIVANSHTPLLFFSNKGIAYKLKAYKLPVGNPQSKGKAIINLLPVEQDETISTIMPLPEIETDASEQSVMFATKSGNVRRNKLGDFLDVRANGKIAMKLDDGDLLIDVKPCNDGQDILLSSKGGKCVRFPVSDVRIFAGRSSTGVRGMKLAENDEVISMSVLNHSDADAATREEYMKQSSALKRGEISELNDAHKAMAANEEFILTITENGYGKRSSSYDYRVTSRGGSGIANIDLDRNLKVVASFPVCEKSQIMLVTNGGTLIRIKASEIRTASRTSLGVILFRLADGESVVSVSDIGEIEDEETEPTDTVATDDNSATNREVAEGTAPDAE